MNSALTRMWGSKSNLADVINGWSLGEQPYPAAGVPDDDGHALARRREFDDVEHLVLLLRPLGRLDHHRLGLPRKELVAVPKFGFELIKYSKTSTSTVPTKNKAIQQ